MKFSPNLALATVLATGVAGAAMAQGTTAPGSTATPQAAPVTQQTTWQPGATHPSFASPQAADQAQPGAMQLGATAAAAPSPAPAGAMQGAEDSQVREAQQRLQAAGLYNGPADGLMDPDTRAALARFQQQNGLRMTEDIDPATMSRLMSSQPAAASGSSAPPSQTPAASIGEAVPTPPTGAGGSIGSGRPSR